MSITKEMLTCTLSEIQLLRKAGASFRIFLRPVRKRDAVWYRIEFVMVPLEGEPEEGILMTTRNDPYVRASLDKTVELLREYFPDTKEFCGGLFPDEIDRFKEREERT